MGRLALGVLVALGAATPAMAEQGRGGESATRWGFVEAWTAFRRDLDASIPGEHGEVYLLEGWDSEPSWLLNDAIRNASSPEVIALLAHRAAKRGDRSAIPALTGALDRSPSERSRRAVEKALVVLGDEAERRRAIRRLRSASAPERWRAATALAAAGSSATTALRAALEDPDGQTRLVAASALAARGDGQARALLQGLLRSANPFERTEAAHGLALAGDTRASAVLRHILKQPGSGRRRAARSLGLVGGDPEKALLLQVLEDLPRDRSRELRRELLVAIGRIACRREMPDVARSIAAIDEELDSLGARAAQLEAVGRAVAGGARDRRAVAAAVARSLADALPHETPAAHARRRRAVGPLAAVLQGRPPPRRPAERARPVNVDEGRRMLTSVGGDARRRTARFEAAVGLLATLGERLGHAALAEPPRARAVGLGAHRAVDGSLTTSWVAGPMASRIQLDLPSPVVVSKVHLIGGCVESRASYERHARVRAVQVTTAGGRPVMGNLQDGDPYFQAVPLPPTKTSRVALEVTDVYPGTKAGAPACVAELRLE